MSENHILRSRKRLRITYLVLLCVILGGCAGVRPEGSTANPESSSTRIEREDLTFELGKGIDTVEISNTHGEISVRDRDLAEVGVHGVVQILPPDFSRAKVVSSRQGNILRLSVQIPHGKTGSRYDMAVYLPRDVNLALIGSVDRVDARKRSGDLSITTTSGNINASTRGRLDVSTVSGTIRAAALAERWFGRSKIRSESGQIIVLAPLSGDISLNAETGGRLSTNFGLSVHARANGGSIAAASYGAGSSELHVDSVSGEVILEQKILLGEDNDSAADVD